MVRLLTLIALAFVLQAAEGFESHQTSVGIDFGFTYVDDGDDPFDKVRDTDEATVRRAYIDYRGSFTDTLTAHVVAEVYDDSLGELVDASQAYLKWRPVPRSPSRFGLKLGAFYPPISMHHTQAGWTSPYTINPSAINTWVGEELRTIGLQLSVSRRFAALGDAHAFSLDAAAFGANDPGGALLAWRGWALHDRQSRLRDELPLPALPQFESGTVFASQAPYTRPFKETDEALGYYVNGEWRYSTLFRLRAMIYDNGADPIAIENGQYGWRTRFAHVGAHWNLPSEVVLISQWMKGTTEMGPLSTLNRRKVDAQYESIYLLASRDFGRHRVTARYDWFDVTDRDDLPMDSNEELGHAWTLSYRMRLSNQWSLAGEWLRVDSDRPGRMYFDADPNLASDQVQLTFRLTL